MVVLRIPYPMGFYAKGLDARIDDPNAGWKGRGLWSSEGDRTPWLKEGGKGSLPIAVHIQVRPDPLAHWSDRLTTTRRAPSGARRFYWWQHRCNA